MDAFRKLFHPLWRVIGANTWISAIVLTLATAASFMLHQLFTGMLLGCALGTVMMLRAERDQAARRPLAAPLADEPAVLPAA